jgi:phosphoglycerate dehydrogenase-like enzyme
MDDLVSMLELSDFVVLSLALTEETRGIINKEILSKLKPGTVLINIGRGALINEEDLIEVLQQPDSPLIGAALV